MKGLKKIITLPYRIVEAVYSIASDILTVERPMVKTTHLAGNRNNNNVYTII